MGALPTRYHVWGVRLTLKANWPVPRFGVPEVIGSGGVSRARYLFVALANRNQVSGYKSLSQKASVSLRYESFCCRTDRVDYPHAHSHLFDAWAWLRQSIPTLLLGEIKSGCENCLSIALPRIACQMSPHRT